MVDFYGTAVGYVAYWTARGTVPDDTTPKIEAALLVASEYLDANYRSFYAGTKVNGRSQKRDWPRQAAYDVNYDQIADDEIPDEIDEATYQAASRELATPGSLRTDAIMGKAIQSVSIDGAVSVVYAGAGSIADLQPTFPAIDAILAPILTGGLAVSTLSGLSGRMI